MQNVDKTYDSENILTGPGMVSTTMPANNWDLGPGVMWSPLCCSLIWNKTIKSQASSHWSWPRHHLPIFLHQTFICNILWQFKATGEGNSLDNFWNWDVVTTNPVPLILDLCWISVEWNKLVGVLNLYWCAGTVSWLRRLHPLKERKKPEHSDKIILWTYLSKRPQEGRLIQANYSPSSFTQSGLHIH